MSTFENKHQATSGDLLKNCTAKEIPDKLPPNCQNTYTRFPNGNDCHQQSLDKRWQYLDNIHCEKNKINQRAYYFIFLKDLVNVLITVLNKQYFSYKPLIFNVNYNYFYCSNYCS